MNRPVAHAGCDELYQVDGHVVVDPAGTDWATDPRSSATRGAVVPKTAKWPRPRPCAGVHGLPVDLERRLAETVWPTLNSTAKEVSSQGGRGFKSHPHHTTLSAHETR